MGGSVSSLLDRGLLSIVNLGFGGGLPISSNRLNLSLICTASYIQSALLLLRGSIHNTGLEGAIACGACDSRSSVMPFVLKKVGYAREVSAKFTARREEPYIDWRPVEILGNFSAEWDVMPKGLPVHKRHVRPNTWVIDHHTLAYR